MSKKIQTAKNGHGSDQTPLDTLKAVYDFMTTNGLDAVEILENDAQVKLVRRKAPSTQVPVPIPVAAGGGGAAATHAAQPAVAAATMPATPPVPLPAGTPIKSPMMGIFYRAPSPSSPPFCKEGDALKPGHVVCMIEAMKVFNEIKIEYPCTVVKCLVENGKPVKAGQDLIIVQR
ncbi:MAG: acetyl-CoA carboxylase biotin carboxyl carrier protein [Elusimicrobiota bacterium]